MLAMQTYWQNGFPWDTQILIFAATHRSEMFDHFFHWVTWFGSLYVLIPGALLAAATLLYYRHRAEVMLFLIGFGGAVLLAHLAKAILARPRPGIVAPLVDMPVSGSFPSAHTTQIVAFALCSILIIRRTLPEWQPLVTVMAALLVAAVGVSRVYLQIHFPSDVLGGLVIGIVWVMAVRKFV
jgi:undecaprenyl-diphosphatase